ncbi:MAG TPA: MarR family transcriptional regulator [Gemmatimonadales bacterium]|nr:MarR family transcriptional regulator [Gemmatimonadales bacterium]
MPPLDPALEAAAHAALSRTADALTDRLAEALRPVELTPTQYGVLRALREAGAAGLRCSDLGQRLVTREPDVTRLLDRLDRRGLIQRWRDDDDRRVVRARLTAEGLRLTNSLDRLVADFYARTLGHLDEPQLRTLLATLERIRQPPV